ncbi:hypothetical protein QEH48_gp109 [Streptomyces phage TurkishDelight]|uniref:Uncharacterized protein n=1 Tax=Streptomyces phage TurkishDelight TaxID=2793708 RepID=A0A7T0Q3Q7_9CAUD|nr:hypothetical protein QEH48_gp109 [Streptomyces phage TurkishDelight]QPL14138.1 hypothetical protein SEA_TURKISHDELIGHT_109 [Streptomyces phage TurkishDelight]
MRDYQTRPRLLTARDNGARLEAGPRTAYAGEAVEYRPTKDRANNHPDFYPWHVVGRPRDARLSNLQVVIA